MLSILTTPLNMAVEGVNAVAEVIKPGTVMKTHLIGAHLWTGFILTKKPPS